MRINDTIPHLLLKILRRKIYPMLFNKEKIENPELENSLDKANEIIYSVLISDKPCMIARYGAFEISTVVNYLYVSGRNHHSIINYIKGEGWEWWWNETTLENMKNNAGVWPNTHNVMEMYCKLFLEDSKYVDVLGCLNGLEVYFKDEYASAIKVPIFNLEPFFSKNPWTKALKGKKVLVIHPFTESIKQQYSNNRNKLFPNQDILPDFDLKLIKSVQSIGGSTEFTDWFEALDYMKRQINETDFDIAIIGCGAYGYNLAAHIKRIGKKAIHLGGVTQILFGIRGARWDNPNEKMSINGSYPSLINEHWCRPKGSETPKLSQNVEGGCYW